MTEEQGLGRLRQPRDAMILPILVGDEILLLSDGTRLAAYLAPALTSD